MKSDLLRYLVLGVQGGVYTDTDTVALKPVDAWIPQPVRDRARLVVGIEFDRRDGGPWADIPHWLQFCQWTIAAAPGHPVFGRMVDRVLRSLDDLSAAHGGVSVEELRPESFEVMNSTGPAAWTDVVFEQLQEYNPLLNDTQDLSFMEEPTLIGDILILPIDGFGMGQDHSASTNDGSIPEAAMMRHLFTGSWRDE
jgi:alpha 1,6-mannosyltransferase